jgi:hypothetical protein
MGAHQNFKISLIKSIVPGTWRYLGVRSKGFSVLDIPIGGVSAEVIKNHIKGNIETVGKIRLENAFIIKKYPFTFLYVRPSYFGYRNVAKRVFKECPWVIDYDHSLGKAIANQLGCKYVLLLRVIPRANRSHGRYERKNSVVLFPKQHSTLCFADDRILDKWLGRMSSYHTLQHAAYNPSSPSKFGLTLKQLGRWAYAIGLEDH